jgi:hypothetical protein
LAPDHTGFLKARYLLLRARGRFSEALVASEALIACNPAEPTAYKEVVLNKLYLGETRDQGSDPDVREPGEFDGPLGNISQSGSRLT